MTSRSELASCIAGRLDAIDATVFPRSGPIRHAVIDDVLPAEVASTINASFPATALMVHKRSLREDKFVAAQMDQHDALLEEAVFAFQEPSVVEAVSRLTGLTELEPDVHLYAGGISSMVAGQFLKPHLDNSHDKDRQRWRVLNLLYYVTPNWRAADGGSLVLWPDGPRGRPIAIASTFNRLVVMETHGRSWHSVTPVTAPGERRCVSNYFFSRSPADAADRPHVTSFRDPTSSARDIALRVDSGLRRALRALTGGRIENPHVYKRS